MKKLFYEELIEMLENYRCKYFIKAGKIFVLDPATGKYTDCEHMSVNTLIRIAREIGE